MKIITATTVIVISALAPAIAQQQPQTATATFIDEGGKDVGKASLTAAAQGGVLIDMQVNGLPANKWVAFHVHDVGKCDPMTKHESAGGHFNPDKKEHGLLTANGPHAGDMPNQYVGDDGILRAQVFDGMVTLDDKKTGIRGRALMIHANSDDYRSQPSGDAGERLACAVIE